MVVVVVVMNMGNYFNQKETEIRFRRKKEIKKRKIVNKNYEPQPFVYYINCKLSKQGKSKNKNKSFSPIIKKNLSV